MVTQTVEGEERKKKRECVFSAKECFIWPEYRIIHGWVLGGVCWGAAASGC